MPIIASQHAWKDKEHVPSTEWPEDCIVQWGGRGVVLSKKAGGSYSTAFFEAFPEDGGFIRGEGKTIAEAETAALGKFRKESVCAHRWGRAGYTNGGAICRVCGAFQSIFKPIPKLGRWRDPLCFTEIKTAMTGWLRPSSRSDEDSLKYRRRVELRLRLAGVKLPETPQTPSENPFDKDDPYARSCRIAVLSWYRDHKASVKSLEVSGIAGLFDGLSARMLELSLEEAEEDGLFDEADAGMIQP